MKKINLEAIAARTCKYVGLCSALGDLTSPFCTTQSSKDKPVIKGLQEPLPFGSQKIQLLKTAEANNGVNLQSTKCT